MAQRSNLPIIAGAVLSGVVVVAVAFFSRGGDGPDRPPAGSDPAPASAGQPPAPPETEPVAHIDLTTDAATPRAPAPEPATEEAGGSAGEVEPGGPPAIFAAAASGDVEALAAAIGEGVDVNGRDGAGLTPLMAAAGAGQVDAVFALLNAGADATLRDNERRAARDHALARYDERGRVIVRILEGAVEVTAVADPTDK